MLIKKNKKNRTLLVSEPSKKIDLYDWREKLRVFCLELARSFSQFKQIGPS